MTEWIYWACGAVSGVCTGYLMARSKRPPKCPHLWKKASNWVIPERLIHTDGRSNFTIKDTLIIQACTLCAETRKVWKSETLDEA